MKRILVLGGTRFFGKKLVELLIEQGHHVAIMTRGQSGNPFGDRVEHMIADRTNKEEMTSKLEGRTFDVVYDNICYSPDEAYALCEVLNGKVSKLVFTSTLSVYEVDGNEKNEADFDPYHYEITMGSKNDFTYSEGKRQAEAVLFKNAVFPVVAVRFPIVMGEDDYTRRLHFHVEHIVSGEPMGFVSLDAEMSFIQADEAARFLAWAGLSDAEGPYNATADGKLSLSQLIALIEEVTGRTANIVMDGPSDIRSPYAIPASWYMTTQKAASQGFHFSNLHDWLKPLIESIASKNG